MKKIHAHVKAHAPHYYSLLALITLLSFVTFYVTKSEAAISSSLTGHWNFNEGAGLVAKDFSENGKTGNLGEGATWTSQGSEGAAVTFNGSKSYVETPVTVRNDSGTLSLWVNPRVSLSQGKNYPVFITGGPGNSLSLFFASWSSVGTSQGNNWTAELMGSYGSTLRAKAPVTTEPRGWTHIAYVWDVQKGISLYINGELKASQSGTTRSIVPIYQLIGASKTASFLGDIDDVRTYNRALEASDVLKLYSERSSTPIPPYQQPTLTLSANPTALSSNGSSQLSWTSTNVTSCVAGGGWSGNKPLAGTESVRPAATTKYTLNCASASGSLLKEVTIQVQASTTATTTPATTTQPVAVSFTLSPTTVSAGEKVTLVWSSSGATSCTAGVGWSGTKALSGSESLTPTNSTSYSLTCSNTATSSTRNANVTVTQNTTQVPSPAGKYRYNQTYLYTSIDALTLPNRISGGSSYPLDGKVGPHNEYVDFGSGWRWANKGGDWIDANLVPMGTNSWAKVLTDKGSTQAHSAAYVADVTAGLKHIQTSGTWNAWIVRKQGSIRTIAGKFNADPSKRPRIEVTYSDGSRATLNARVVANLVGGQSAPLLGASTYSAQPITMEFEKPTKPVSQANLHFFVTEHWTGPNSTILFDIANPPINNDQVRYGIANKYVTDRNLKNEASIIGYHRYADGVPLTEYFENDKPVNYEDRRNYSPHLWDSTKTPDTTKYPYKGLGKWVGSTSENFTMINSSYNKEGFEPLAPGLGALRVHMPADTEIGKTTPIVDGSDVGYSGTKAADAKIYMPEDKYGLLDDIYVRYYVRIGDDPYYPTKADRKQITTGGPIKWTDMAGKFLINVAHKTKYGGNSGVAGGGRGWSLRPEFSDAGTNADESGLSPTTNSYGLGFSWYDYYYNNYNVSTNPYGQPLGYNYGNFSRSDKGPGQRGGLASNFYKNKWYLVEIHMKLNSVNQKNPQDNRYWTPDGMVQMWVDGRLAYEKTGVVFRSLPVVPPAPATGTQMPVMPPVRELGVAELWFNWFHGGVTRNTIPRTLFISGLAWGTEYIGPMKME